MHARAQNTFDLSLFFFLLSPRTNKLNKKKKKCHEKNPPSCSFDCRTITVCYYCYYYSTCMCIQYRLSLPYRADRSARYGKGRLYYARIILYVHPVYYTWLLDSRKEWAANIAIEWLPCGTSSIIPNLKVKIKNLTLSFF